MITLKVRLMKALRSLEQHIDSLDIGRYSDLLQRRTARAVSTLLMTAVS